ncbi:hypothetical protein WME99_30520 [Sorangium sp. So ce136]|uniref:hypothetical protein n=1 Tax=Sorangium sp. So ce136 TaxID=3133284 RepID=UPI003F09D5EF
MATNTGATSYPLRQLAQRGFIVEDEARGNARHRWWKVAHRLTPTAPADNPDAQAAQDAFLRAVAVVRAEHLQRAVEEAELLPAVPFTFYDLVCP